MIYSDIGENIMG